MGIIRAARRSTTPAPSSFEQTRSMPIEPPEVVEADSTTVACEGNDSALGHPRVFLSIGQEGFVDCPYCDRRFVLKDGASSGAGH